MRAKDGPVYIYVIAHRNADGWQGPCKIGIAASPSVRLSGLQSGNPRPIGVYGHVEAPGRYEALRVEQFMHFHHQGERLVGEWFQVEPEVALQGVSLAVATEIMASGHDAEGALKAALMFTRRAPFDAGAAN